MVTRNKTPRLSSNQIRKWLDDELQIISEIEQRESDDTEFRYVIWCKNLNINLFKSDKDRPLVLATESVFPKQKLDILQGARQDHFISQLTSVLTLAPGFLTFTDGKGKSTNPEDMEAVYIEHRIYPDKASQHELMTSIIDMFTALMYIHSVIDSITKNIEQNR